MQTPFCRHTGVIRAALVALTLCCGLAGAVRAGAASAFLSVTGTNTLALDSNGVPAGFRLKGDIVVPLRKGVQSASLTPPNPWPDGVVPYQFDANVTTERRLQALKAMDRWGRDFNGRIAFVPRTSQASYVHIQNHASLNNSPVGRIGGVQIINVHDWEYLGIVAHEIGHALGLHHEQSRPDRDTYVTVYTNRVIAGKEHNFDQETWMAGTTSTPYDYESIMHYERCAFSAYGQCSLDPTWDTSTIVPTSNGGPENGNYSNMGQTDYLRGTDGTDILNAYGSGPSRYVDPAGGGVFAFEGGVEKPWFTMLGSFGGATYASAAGVPGTRLWAKGNHYAQTGRITGPVKILPIPGTGTVRIGP